MPNMISVLNTIRSNASKNYQDTVPVATQSNFLLVGNAILSYTPNMNEFADSLVNRVALTVVQAKNFKNPLSVLKKGGIPYGQDIQEIYTNPAIGGTYDGSSTQLLSVFKSDNKVAYYRLNRKGKFVVTIAPSDLQRAFTSLTDLDQFTQGIINSMTNGDEIEQFELTKELIANAYENNMLTINNIYDAKTESSLTDADISKRLVKAIQTYSENIVFPSTQYNQFATKKGGGATPVKTWTPKKDQILILSSTAKVNMNVELLASAFNKSMLELDAMTLTIDSFVGEPIFAILCDKSCFQIYENLLRTDSFYNGDTMMTNYYLHHWQTYGFSLLANSIAFTYTPATVDLATGSLGVAGDGKITGLTVTTQYDVSVDNKPSTVLTSSASGELTGLDNSNTYYVKLHV